jgi:hypothetical protein
MSNHVNEHSYFGHLPWQSKPSEDPYFQARDEYAWHLRAAGTATKEIARRLGVSRSKPKLMVLRHEVRLEMAESP